MTTLGFDSIWTYTRSHRCYATLSANLKFRCYATLSANLKQGSCRLKTRKKVASRRFFFAQNKSNGERMRFYHINDAYLEHLRQFDTRVPQSAGDGYQEKKLYIGIVLEIGSHKFLAPLSSYKPYQDRIPASNVSIFKIHERGNPANKLGVVALRYMLPVPDSELIPVDISQQNPRYQRMLYKQYEFLKTNQEAVKKAAAELYEHVVNKRTQFYVSLTCDISKLVDEQKNYLPPSSSSPQE